MFELKFETTNDAFQEAPDLQIRAILRGVAHSVTRGEQAGTISDSNGNTVGSWALADDRRDPEGGREQHLRARFGDEAEAAERRASAVSRVKEERERVREDGDE